MEHAARLSDDALLATLPLQSVSGALRRESPLFNQGLPGRYANGQIDRKQVDSCPANRGCSNEKRAIPSKVLLPVIAAWVKQRYEHVGFPVDAGDVRTFEAIATSAAQGQVFHYCLSTVLTRAIM
ncbi:MAG TPA: hypothetical protein VH370_24675 [Humisphaera sp.]|jgi:hypothetical protein|nr:hypothetical protein [Humisphaera sp.]